MNILNTIIEILVISVPLLAISTGALFTEYCGVLAIFSDGIINLSAFLFFTFSTFTNNLFLSIILAILICCLFIFFISYFTQKTNSNPFLIGLGINLFSSGLILLLSKSIFHTQGVLTNSNIFTINTQLFSKPISMIVIYGLAIASFFFFKYTKLGLCFRVVGSTPKLITNIKKQTETFKISSWVISTFFSCLAGIILVLRISSFVPNISSSRGWIALAAILAGQKKIPGTIIAILVFSIFEFIATSLQGILPNIPPSILLCTPYVIAIISFFIIPNNSSLHE